MSQEVSQVWQDMCQMSQEELLAKYGKGRPHAYAGGHLVIGATSVEDAVQTCIDLCVTLEEANEELDRFSDEEQLMAFAYMETMGYDLTLFQDYIDRLFK